MEVVVRLGSSEDAHSKVFVNMVQEDPTIDEILKVVRQELSPWQVAVMERGIEGLQGPEGIGSVVGGVESMPLKASLFLSLQTDDGPKKLEGTKRTSDYKIDRNSSLWLMCSAKDFDKR